MTMKNGLDAERELDIFVNIEREKQIIMLGWLLETEELIEDIIESVKDKQYIHDASVDGQISSPDYEAIGIDVYDKLMEGNKIQ